VRPQPRFHLLIAGGFSPGVGTGAERGDKQGSLSDCSRGNEQKTNLSQGYPGKMHRKSAKNQVF
jgi:hypothetical protein